ncbi:FadR/GntR family transcriptional regulator [Marinitenerispora sediminis]|uniref:GntR family transcriptional regulator n=1 Tax=Marinitenerispora sediminis TaxID=1931232 RepID=A0A368TBN9_9ACTN|nr:FCD domain-containing protein [Marinitenerispora sediminis]RCV57973.1 GntR family transcriptional regulator [Marinitenerispora sediminis]RCV62295.1 GntR family transcriptional regulator [Marinitenerispora sediminis]RCV62574.1 GntR family transcriptional regulator [Marinitenerispora sediminis]
MAAYSGRGVHGQTVRLLAERVLSGAIGEGQTIDLAALSAELGLSLTAIREAIKVLAAKGLVGSRQKKGTFVRPRGDWNLLDPDVVRWQIAAGAGDVFFRDLAELRDALEPAAALLAAQRRTDADVAELRAALADIADSAEGPAEAAARADLRWHRALLAATHNELFVRTDVFFAAGLSERDRLVHGGAHGDPVPSHGAVTEAVAAGDALAAESAMRSLLDQARADLLRITEDDAPEDDLERPQ